MVTEDRAAVRKPLIERVRERKARHKERSKLYRLLFALLAVAVTLLGLALVPLPGPGWLIVALGLAMLALEFDRAERVLELVLHRLEKVGSQAANSGPLAKAGMAALAVIGAAGLVTAAVLWEIPYLPG